MKMSVPSASGFAQNLALIFGALLCSLGLFVSVCWVPSQAVGETRRSFWLFVCPDLSL